MGRKVAYAPRRGGRARWFVLGALLVLGGAGYVVHLQASSLAAQALNVAFGNADTDIKGLVYPDWNGDVVASDVTLYLDGPTVAAGSAADSASALAASDDAGQLHFDALRVEVDGGWQFFLRNLVDPRLAHADVDGFKLSLDGFDSKAGVDPTFGALGPIGAISASPFESEGCMAHAFFVRSELEAMGLAPQPTSLSYDIREADSRVATRIVLNTPGVSRAQYDREETLAKDTSLLHLADTATSTHAERWDVSDQGFIARRNAWCAKQDGVDESTFVGRHLAAVLRLLQARGLVPDAATSAAYADFATKGGQFAFGGRYATPMHSSERAKARTDGSALLRLEGKFEHAAAGGPVQWRGTMPRALDAQAGSTFAAMVKEHGGVAPSVGALAPPPAADATPVVVRSAQGEVRKAAPRYASSLPSAMPTAPLGSHLAWSDLPRYQGHMLRMFTSHAEPRTAMLVSVDGSEAHVRAPMDGGHADYRISRQSFVRAMLIQ